MMNTGNNITDEKQISVFRSYFDPNPVLDVSVEEFCANVYWGIYKDEITKLRTLTDKTQRDKVKATLPACTISGTFSKRDSKALIQHSGFICLDFDAKGNEHITDWPALRNSLADIKNVYFSALSASGQGVFLIVPILKPYMHKEHFKALQNDFNALGLTVDKACSDVSRLRGLSYDPEAIFNEDAKIYTRYYEQPKPKRFNEKKPLTEDQKVINAKKWLDGSYSFVPGERHNYIKQFAGVLNRFGVDENTAHRELTSYSTEDFTKLEIEKIIQHMYSKNYSNN
jgi:BT4734-like, N-terminal domain